MRHSHTTRFSELDGLLRSFGFRSEVLLDGNRAYRHPDVDVVFLLGRYDEDDPVRQADLVSIVKHLAAHGFDTEAALKSRLLGIASD